MALSVHLRLTLRFSPKPKVKAMAEFPTAWLIVEGMPQHAHGAPRERLGDLLVPGS